MERRSSGRSSGRGPGGRSSSESPARKRAGKSSTVTSASATRSSSIGSPQKRKSGTTTSAKGVVVAQKKSKIIQSPSKDEQIGKPDKRSSASAHVGSDEVLLNRRGVPARQIKRNRLYYDGDNVNEGALLKQTQKSPKKIKQEPIEQEDGELEDSNEGFTYASTEVGDVPMSAFPNGTSVNRQVPIELKTSTANNYAMHGKASISARLVQPKQNKKGSTPRKSVDASPSLPSISRTVDRVDTPKGVKTPAKSPRVETGKGSSSITPNAKGNRTPKSGGKSEIQSAGKIEIERRSHYQDDETQKTYREVKIKKERDLEFSEPNEEYLYYEKIRKKNHRERREKERNEFRLEKERHDHDLENLDMIPTSALIGRGRRSSSFSENENITLPNEIDAKPSLSIDKKSAQSLSLRLRNLLKLPKAHKWVCYEWFYSNIDKVLFEGENDFQICFRESFPQLKTKNLTRVEWTKIRRLMGKPRRCSQSFFDEERKELNIRRQKIRAIQQRKVTDFNYKELPDEIPLQLVIGTKVTTRLRHPQDGLFIGCIDGVDTSNNTYRITFERAGLGTQSIPDYEVLSNEPPETVSTSSFALKVPRRNYGAFSGGQFKFHTETDVDNGLPKSPFPLGGMLGGFPIRLLDMIVRLSKLLKAKREKILHLKELNVEAEKMRSYGKTINSDFRCRYARCVLDLSSMNREMAIYLDGVQQYCLEIAPDHGANQMIVPEHVQEHCDQEAALIVANSNAKPNRMPVQDPKTLNLITKLASMMLQAKTLSSGERNLYEVKSIKESLKDVKASLEGRNVQLFQDRIEIPMNRIQAGLTIMGNN